VGGELVNFGVNRRYGAVLCRLAGVIISTRDLLLLTIHLLATLAKFLGPGGVRWVAAESLLLKHQLLPRK
jgi:hypothetical protein